MKKSCILFVAFVFIVINASKAQESETALDHIAVYVSDLEKSTDFYQNILGLQKIPEPFHDGKHTWFSLGPIQLHLIEGAAAASVHNKNAHLSFSVPSIPDFLAILKNNGLSYENWTGEKHAVTNRVDGVKQIYLTDPDGYWIEVNDAKR